MNDFGYSDFSFHGKDELKPADISNVRDMSVGVEMSNAVLIALMNLTYENELINDATYRNALKNVKR